MFAAPLALLFVAASGAARASTPVVLPPGQVAATWAEPLNLADLRVGAAGSGTWVELVDRGETWAVRVRSTSGRLDEALVPEPRTAAEREDVAWLARSLLAPPSAVSSWDDVAALEPAARASNVGAVASPPATATAAPAKGAAPATPAVTTNTAPTAASASTATPASKGAAAPTTAAPTKATGQTTAPVTTATTPTKTAKTTVASTASPTSTTKAPATSPTTAPSAPTTVATASTTVASAQPNAATLVTTNAAQTNAAQTTASATPATPPKPAPATTKAPTAKASRTPVATPTAVTSTPPAVAAPTAPTSPAPTPSPTVATVTASSAALSTEPERRTASATVTGPRPYAHADGGVGWRPDATLAPRVGIDAGVQIPLASLGITVGAGAAWTPRRALAVGEGSEQVEAVDATARLGLRVPVALSPTVAVFGGASVRSYLADGTAVVTAPVPVAGLAVSVHVPLIFGLSLTPSLGVQTDLRPVSVAIGAESAGALSPVELNAGLGLGWSQKD